MKSLNKFLLLFLTLVICSQVKAVNEQSVFYETHTFDILNIDEYISRHSFEGINLLNKPTYFHISIREGSELNNLDLVYIEGDKRKKIRVDKTTITSDVSYGSFFNGVRTYFIPIDQRKHFAIEYSVKEKNTVFISTIYSKGYYNATKCTYLFNFPSQLTISGSNGKKWTSSFQLMPEDFTTDTSKLFLLVHPANEDKEVYFSNWFSTRINNTKALQANLVPAELTELNKTATKTEMAAACFKYIQNQVRYLDIENGLNAIIPRECNVVLQNKYGDCKDMANALVSILQHFGFEAYNCISKTNGNTFTFDFPSLGQANHMVAGLKLNDEWIFLDPTESNCIFGDPSIQILGTEVFAIGHAPDFFQVVPKAPKSESKVVLNYQIDLTKRTIKVELHLLGKTNTLLFNKRDNHEIIQLLTNKTFPYALPLVNKEISNTTSRLIFEGEFPKAFISELSTKTIVQTQFLADTKNLFLLACYQYFPNYPIQIVSTFVFKEIPCESILTKSSIWERNCLKNELLIQYYWPPADSEKEFDKTEQWTNFTTEKAKPLIVTP